MKLINPILISINNILHIKSDNLEPVEVDNSCVKEFRRYAYLKYSETMEVDSFAEIDENIVNNGVDISELSDRIEVREVKVNAYNMSSTAFVIRAFLLPEKEDIEKELFEMENKLGITGNARFSNSKLDSLKERKDIEDAYRKQFGIAKSYTIEEIEKAIDKLPFSQVLINTIKSEVIKQIQK